GELVAEVSAIRDADVPSDTGRLPLEKIERCVADLRHASRVAKLEPAHDLEDGVGTTVLERDVVARHERVDEPVVEPPEATEDRLHDGSKETRSNGHPRASRTQGLEDGFDSIHRAHRV